MKLFYKYLLILFLLSSTSYDSFGQFWKGKGHHKRTASNGITKKKKGGLTKDAFRRKSKKGPNQKTSSKPIWRSKKNMRRHAISRKSKQGGSKDFHKRRTLSKSALKPSSGSTKGEKRGRKSSKGDKGSSRGRKK